MGDGWGLVPSTHVYLLSQLTALRFWVKTGWSSSTESWIEDFEQTPSEQLNA